MRKLCSVLLAVSFVCLIFIGSVFAAGNGATVSLDSPGSSQSFKPGENVRISGKALNIDQVTVLVRNSGGGVAYAAQPPVINNTFSTEFQLNDDAVEGKYTIRIGAEGLAAPVDFTFMVSKVSGSSSSSGSGGGSSNSGSGGEGAGASAASEALTSSTGSAAEAQDTSLIKDIAGHWAFDNIKKLVAMDAVSGYPDGSFKPDNSITRAEFAAVLVKAFKLENKGGKTFVDTMSHWAKDSIAAAAANGIINGYDADTFGPDDLITREQMTVMVVKAAKLAPAPEETRFADSSGISNWAREAMAAATGSGIINGYPDNTVRPRNSATRGEAITVIVNALNQK